MPVSDLRFLAIDSSTDTLSVALGTGAPDGVVWQHSGPGGAMASTTLLPLVKQALDAAGWPLASLDAVVMLAYALVGARAIRLLHRRAVRWLDRCCGGALLALAASLALYRRGVS